MQPPAFSLTKTESNTDKPELNTKSVFTKKSTSTSTSTWEEGLIFDPKIFEEKTKSFLETFHNRNTKKRELNFENENEKEEKAERREKKKENSLSNNDDDIDLISPTVLTINTSKNTTSSFSFSPYTFEKLIFTSFEGRCLESILRVKSYLKSIYLLSDEKCQLFSPDEKVRKCYTFISIFFFIFSIVFILCFLRWFMIYRKYPLLRFWNKINLFFPLNNLEFFVVPLPTPY